MLDMHNGNSEYYRYLITLEYREAILIEVERLYVKLNAEGYTRVASQLSRIKPLPRHAATVGIVPSVATYKSVFTSRLFAIYKTAPHLLF